MCVCACVCVCVCVWGCTDTDNLLYIVLKTSGEHLPIHVFAAWPQGPLEEDETPVMHISPCHSDAKTAIMKERSAVSAQKHSYWFSVPIV